MNQKQISSHTAEQSDKFPVWCSYPHFKKRVVVFFNFLQTEYFSFVAAVIIKIKVKILP